MAVGVVLNFKGGTLEQYDDVVGKMGFSPGGPGAPGGMFHWVTKTDDGIRVTDVWQSQEFVRALNRPEVKARLNSSGIEIVGSSPEEYAASMRSDIARTSKLIKDANIRKE